MSEERYFNAESDLHSFLQYHKKNERASFHMPGHKGSRIFEQYGYAQSISDLVNIDITEIEGADNLFQAEGCIKATMDLYRELYSSKHSYLLVNGSSCGLIAAIMATMNKGDSIIVASNCHKSVTNALFLCELKPIYVSPRLDESWSVSAEVEYETLKKLVEENHHAKAIVITSPNYYGVLSDIERIKDLAHENNMVLIVDKAHGAHLDFFDRLKGQNSVHGDIEITSTHKTLASFTQSAIINIYSEHIDIARLENALQIMQTSSPSYILMLSLSINAQLIKKHELRLFQYWNDNLEFFYKEVKKLEGISIMELENLDHTKLNLKIDNISGYDLESKLREHGIYCELANENLCMAMTGIGNSREDYELLLDILGKISKAFCIEAKEDISNKLEIESIVSGNLKAELKEYIDRRKKKELVYTKDVQTLEVFCGRLKNNSILNLSDAIGKICTASIIPYPPGIPLICVGQIYTKEVLFEAAYLRSIGIKVLGLSSDGCVSCGILT